MTFGVLGASHQHASLEELESIYITKEDAGAFIDRLLASSAVKELVVLTTCNRMEYYFVAQSCEEAAVWLKEAIAQHTGTPLEKIEKILKFRKNEEAITHLFSVASGIKSMVFGENEILAQVKDSYEISKAHKGTGAVLNKTFQMAVAVGKRVRTETGISRGAYSVSSIAIEAIRDRLLDYFGRKILIIGLGVMGLRSLKKLAALGHPDITLSNRSIEKAIEIARTHHAKYLPLEEALKRWPEFDIIITATSSPKYILDTLPQGLINTKLIIDLGMPRNVKPAISPEIDIMSVEGLKATAEKNVQKRQVELEFALEIIEDEKKKLEEWQYHRSQV